MANAKSFFNKLISSNPTEKVYCKEVESYFLILQNELEGNEEEIIKRINSNNLIIRDLFPGRKKERKTRIDEKGNDFNNNSPEPKNELSPRGVIFPKIPERPRLKSMNSQIVNECENGISNKLESINNKGKTKIKKIKPDTSHGITDKQMNNIKLLKNKEEKKAINEEETDIDVVINCDYENSTNDYYSTLCNRKENFEKINKNIIRNIKENEKIYEKKIRETEKDVETNKNKLKSLQEENDLLKQEITEMEKMIQLNLEENNIRAEVKKEELKFIKDSNNVSQTRNEILHDLKLLKTEEDRINSQMKDHQVIIEKNEEESNKEDLNKSNNYNENLILETDVNLSYNQKIAEMNNNDSSFNKLQPDNTSNLLLNNINI